MADQLMTTLQAALQQLATRHTVEKLGDRSTYLGASDIGACPRKTILGKRTHQEADLVTLLRYRRGHMAEDIVATALTAAAFTNFKQQVEVRHKGAIPIIGHLDFVFVSEARKTMAVLEVKAPENIPDHPHGAWETQLYLQIQATTAHFYNGGFSRISGIDPEPLQLGRSSGTIRSIRARKIGNVVNKVLISAEQFERQAQQSENHRSAIVFGVDMAAVKHQAYHRLDNSTTMPLKPQWRDWLWDEVLQPEWLYSFGNPHLHQAWRISWQEADLEDRILKGIRLHALQ